MVLRQALLTASNSELMRLAATNTPIARGVVARFVAGETVADAVRVAGELSETGLHCTIDHLGEDTTSEDVAGEATNTYVRLLAGLGDADLTDRAEVSVKLGAIGQALPDGGEAIAFENARRICQAAAELGTTVTLDMEDHTTTDSTLDALAALRKDFPSTGAVLQACLKRTEKDARSLSHEGSRVRLCKGAYAEPASVAYQSRQDVDLAYVRALKILMRGEGYPMIATHDPRLIEIAGALAVRTDREHNSYEYQMLYGVRPDEQRRLASLGERVRVYVPFGSRWYAYLVRRMAEKPANLGLLVKALSSKS